MKDGVHVKRKGDFWSIDVEGREWQQIERTKTTGIAIGKLTAKKYQSNLYIHHEDGTYEVDDYYKETSPEAN